VTIVDQSLFYTTRTKRETRKLVNETVEHGAIYTTRRERERDREKRYVINTKREREREIACHDDICRHGRC
jgi:hypothetical protein